MPQFLHILLPALLSLFAVAPLWGQESGVNDLRFAVLVEAGLGDEEVRTASHPSTGEEVEFLSEAVVHLEHLASVEVRRREERIPGHSGHCSVVAKLTEDGHQRMSRITSDHLGEYAAVVYDGEVMAMPVLQTALGGIVQAGAGLECETAREMVRRLRVLMNRRASSDRVPQDPRREEVEP